MLISWFAGLPLLLSFVQLSNPSQATSTPADTIMAPTISTLSCGMLFGAALTASGVYDPRVIVSQLKMQDFHMLQTFMTASATGA